ncbi:hypothetical protein BDV29DRAFT_155239 [Aspergillus leporis]|uniref:BTB domain-containing protein n=1 Tax=Aspergillus leporis TaxID=41062 RepID=A0A5N5X532_9EURO|nr:hypothetical protein BDV29DRAFT_155239 [Aspergillus leporis]
MRPRKRLQGTTEDDGGIKGDDAFEHNSNSGFRAFGLLWGPCFKLGNILISTSPVKVALFRYTKRGYALQSSFFNAACSPDFKEMHDKEIDLPEDAPMIVEKVFKFPYSGTYSDDEDSDQLPSDPSMMGSADAQDELGGTDPSDTSENSNSSSDSEASSEPENHIPLRSISLWLSSPTIYVSAQQRPNGRFIEKSWRES